ncbi:MAG: hypothetical protein V3W22_00545 [Thermoplasmata archaeon]
MRLAAVLIFTTALLLSLLTLPGPGGLSPLAQATHRGDVVCPPGIEPVHDGVLHPGEYSENFFDPRTKILVYFSCMEDTTRPMHVALMSPSDDWTEMRFQATDEWNGDFNAVRLSLLGSAVNAIDGFVQGTGSDFIDDLTVGGSYDVLDPVVVPGSNYHVYEFAFPLSSFDVYDSQLAGNGSFYFQLGYADDAGSTMESDPHFIQIGQNPPSGRWTFMELSLPWGAAPLEEAEILVSLRDETFRPLALKPVSVFANTAFGFLDIGTVLTNEQGVASVKHTPRDEGAYLLGAAFAGESGYLASVDWHQMVMTSPTPQPTQLPEKSLQIQTIIVIIVGGVWGTYAYCLFVLRQALRAPDRNRRPDVRERGGQHT